MAVSNITQLANAILVIDTVVAATPVVAKASSAVLYSLELDNSAVAAATYFKLYNTGTVTVGTTVPDWVIMIPASVSRTITMPTGFTFGTALTYAAVTTGGTAGTVATTGNFALKIVYV